MGKDSKRIEEHPVGLAINEDTTFIPSDMEERAIEYWDEWVGEIKKEWQFLLEPHKRNCIDFGTAFAQREINKIKTVADA